MIERIIEVIIRKRSLDFFVKVSLMGELVEIECLFKQLPVAAQKLMYGDQLEEFDEYINAIIKNAKYVFPLQLTGFTDVHELREITAEIKEERNRLKWSDNFFDTQKINDPWVKAYYQLLATASPNRFDQTYRGFQALGNIFSDSFGTPAKGIQELMTYKIPIAEEVLRAYLLLRPTHDYDMQVYIYRTLAVYPSEATKKLLLTSFNKTKSRDVRAAIIRAFQPYEDKKVYRLLVNNLKNFDFSDAYEVISTLNVFANYNTPEVKKICWKMTKYLGDRDIGYHAFKTLLKLGVSEKRIANRLLLILKTPADTHLYGAVFRVFANLIPNSTLLPSTNAIFKTFITVHEVYNNKDDHFGIVFSTAKLLRKKYRKNLPKVCYQAILHENPNVRQAVIHLACLLFENYDCPFVPMVKMKNEVIRSLKSIHQKERIEAIDFLGYWGFRKNDASLIDHLLPFVNTNTEYYECRDAIRAINKIHEVVPFNQSICGPYFDVINGMRRDVTDGLKLSKEIEVLRKLNLLHPTSI